MHGAGMVGESKVPETLAERFWSLARVMEGDTDSTEPVTVVDRVLAVLDALEAGKVGRDLSASTINFLTLLRQYEVRGDLLYASPEQARGEQVDERSLVFSVGVLLFEKLTGRHPFGADGNPQRLARIQRGEMASGVNYFPRVPAELRVVLLKAMGPFPEERWNSLSELRAQLQAFVGYARHPGNGRLPVRTRPLPALPGETPVEPPARRATQPSTDLRRMASMSGRHSAIRPELDVAVETERAPRDTERMSHKRMPPGAWAFGGVVAGAVVTSMVFLAAWPDARTARPPLLAMPEISSPTPSATTTRSPSANRSPASSANASATTTRSPSANRSPASSTNASADPDPRPSANPGPTAIARPNPNSRVLSDPAVPPLPTAAARSTHASPAAAFDPDAGGAAALTAVRDCVASDRKARFGASLLYDVEAGLSRRVYFGAVEQLRAPERACLETRLVGLSAGAAPERAAIVTYSFHLSPSGDHVKAHLKHSP